MPVERARWLLRVSLGVHRPGPGERYRGMVYLYPPGAPPRPRHRTWDAGGIPLWFLTPAAKGTLRELHSSRESPPPDRRHLRAWARAVRPEEVNIEVSDLGTVLQARYGVPEGVWLHTLLVGKPRGDPPLRLERVEQVGDPPPGPLELSRGIAQYRVQVERQDQEGGA